MPGITVTDIPVPARFNTDAKNPPTAPPTRPHTKGFTNLRLTPKIAGSVIPSEAESADGKARALSFSSLVLIPTASVAPACAEVAAEISALKAFTP